MAQPCNTEFDSASQELFDSLAAHVADGIHGEARHDETMRNGERNFVIYRWNEA